MAEILASKGQRGTRMLPRRRGFQPTNGVQSVKASNGPTSRASVRSSQSLTGISLFSGGGVGDLALRAAGVEVLLASELLADRAEVYRANYPESEMVIGDIRETREQLISRSRELLAGRPLDVLFATPPCQGMSKNGRGKLLNGHRAGIKPQFDDRNLLALEAVEIARTLQPRLLVFENVPEMENTLIERPDGKVAPLLDTIRQTLAPLYSGKSEVVEFADYGIPQRRQRLITVFGREEFLKQMVASGNSLLPERTHSQTPSMFSCRWVSVSEALAGVPKLDAGQLETASCETIPFHRVPVLDADKYFWVSSTPPGRGAFDNQCVNPGCRFAGNPVHGSKHDTNGINRANKTTPVRCLQCGSLLPRPWVIEDGDHRLMSGFTSAYKRMRCDLPASALTRNLSYACSDQKLHPTEHRVLSLHEALILHTIADYDFAWKRLDGKPLSDKTIREIIGESIPPRGLEILFRHLFEQLLPSTVTRP